MKEIEIKLKYTDEVLLRNKLRDLKAKFVERYEIVDYYYTKNGETMKTAENLLRIRTKKGASEFTFKGGRENKGDIWERVEINVPIGNAENMIKILDKIGFSLIRKNKTMREYFLFDNTELVIVKIIEPVNLEFVEIEGKTKESIEKVVKLFKGVLVPVGRDYFRVLD